MNRRITDKTLQAQVDRLNCLTGSPATPYIDGVAQAGCFHLSYAYGGVALHRMGYAGGGVTSPLHCGHIPRRQLSDLITALTAGYDAALTAQHNATA